VLKQQAKLFTRLTILGDFFILLLSFCLAYHLRKTHVALREFHVYLWALLVSFPIWYFVFSKNRLYSSIRKSGYLDVLVCMFRSHLFAATILSATVYVVDKHFSRTFLGYFLLISFGVMILERFTIKQVLSFFRRKGFNTRHLVIIGTGDLALNFSSLVADHRDWGLVVEGFLTDVLSPAKSFEVARFGPVLGTVDDLIDVCKDRPIDEVIFCLPKDYLVEFEDKLKVLEEMGITFSMVLDFFDVDHYRKEVSFFHGTTPILTFHPKTLDGQQIFLKRCLDLSGSFLGLCFLAVVFPFIAVAIKLNSRGPIFYSQYRIGMNNRIFQIWKFRSMYADADTRRSELEGANEINGAMFKLEKDPRVTAVGRFLRKTSLDEVPQFWNVLKGEMSLVGTRPPTSDEVANYENWHRRRICIKPGITGKWQVSGRSEIKDFDKIVRLDLEYIDSWSLWLDLKILLKTCWVVFARKGSC